MSTTIIGNVQLWIWFIALLEFVLGLYILALNYRHTANRHVSSSLILIAVNTFAAGSIIARENQPQAYLDWILLVVTTPAMPPLLFLTTVAVLKPAWLSSRVRWLWRLVYVLILFPAALIMIDQLFNPNFWLYTIDIQNLNLQFINSSAYTQGNIIPYLRILNLVAVPVVTILMSLYIALFDRTISTTNRKFAWFIFIAGLIAATSQFTLTPYLIPVVGFVLPGFIWTLIFSLAAFQQMISERQSQTGSLQVRLTALILIVTIPILVATILLTTSTAANFLNQNLLDDMHIVHKYIKTTLEFSQNTPEMNIDLLNYQAHTSPLGEKGLVYVVDGGNRVIVHSDPQLSDLQIDFSKYAPIRYIRNEMSTTSKDLGDNSNDHGVMFTFTDEYGQQWRALASELENEWAIFVQIPENEIFASSHRLNLYSWFTLTVSSTLILLLSMLTIRQGLLPIKNITETASAIASGDLSRIAPINSEGEFGLLANAFNSMTNQLRELIANLERRVSDRTHEIEKHALQLEVAAQVASEAAAIHDLEQLLDHTVHLISDRFDFYHAGIFLIDDTGRYAVLRAASSDGGRRMLARGHKLEVGEKGIVGYVAGKGEPRIALNVGEDIKYFDNPDMPRTRSEMALPLIVRQEITGVLDVQSTKASAFTQDDINVLQILADQIALALDNARLLAESMQAFNELEKVYKQEFKLAWFERLANQKISYSYDRFGIHKNSSSPLSSIEENEDPHILKLPLSFRDLSLGSVTLRRANDQPPWSIDDVQMVKTTISQIVLALENARLMEEIRRHAHEEETLNKISANAHSSLDLETVMKKAVKDIGYALGAQKVQIRLTNTEATPEPTASPDTVQMLGS